MKGKFGKIRRVPIDEAICAHVHKHCGFERNRYVARLAVSTDRLILGPKPKRKFGPMTARYLQKEFKLAGRRAGMSVVTPHLLRHHYAAHFLLRAWKAKNPHANGDPALFEIGFAQTILSVELITLMKSLGHSNLETTMKYLYALSPLMGSDLHEQYDTELEAA